jgi:hypothetical protein
MEYVEREKEIERNEFKGEALSVSIAFDAMNNN